MKILWICPFFPYPLSTGIQIREYNLIRNLSASHEIYLFSLTQTEEEKQYVSKMKKLCKEVWAVYPENKHEGSLDGKRTISDVFLGLFDPNPKYVYGTPSPNALAAMNEVLAEHEFDLLLVDSIYMTNYIWNSLKSLKTKKILVEHNIECLIQQQRVKSAGSKLRQLRKWIYYRNFRRYEIEACRRFDALAAVSEDDLLELQKLLPEFDPANMDMIPNGVDVSLYAWAQAEPKPDTLIFNGALTYEANYEAMQFFLTEVFPLILAERPQTRLYITGSTKGVALEALPKVENVIFTGFLDDIRKAVKESWVCVVPLTWGGGTRLKILEALAAGVPVVATSKGAEGLALRSGYNIFIEDKPAKFAKAVIDLLRDEGLRSRIGAAGFEAVSEGYDWHPISSKLQAFIKKIAG